MYKVGCSFNACRRRDLIRFHRPSQLADGNPLELAERLSQSLRDNGDLDLAAPNLNDSAMDQDEDEIMLSATRQSQFTQSLMLFVCSSLLVQLPVNIL